MPGGDGIRGSKDLRAGLRKYLRPTNERKKMSTKTIKQRIAVVAASALTAGFLSVVSMPVANATAGLTVAANGADSSTSRGIVSGTTGSALTGASNTMTMLSNGSLYVTAGSSTTTKVRVTNGTITSAAGSAGTITISTAGSSVTNSANEATTMTIVPTAAGTMTVIQDTSSTSGTASVTLTVTVVAASTVGKLSPANSFARLDTAAASAEVTSFTDVSGASRVANGGQGFIGFTLHDENDVDMPSTTVVGCSASGGAVCSFTSATFLSTSSADTYGSSGWDTIYVGQGTANTAISTVVTITVNGAVWITKSLSLLGPVAKITIGAAEVSTDGGIYGTTGTSDGDIGLKVTDSLDRLLTSVATTISGSSYNNSVTGYGTATTGSSTSLATSVSFTCSSTAGSADVVATVTNAKNELITSNSFKVYCSGAAYSYTAALDKAVYVPGDIATLTVTAKDSKGNPAADSSTVGSASYPVAIVGSNMTAATAPTNTDTFKAGVKKYTFVVGSSEGAYQLSVSMPIIDAAVLVPYTIKASSATVSNADVLKSIVSLIASINKQIQALQKLILKR